MKLFNFSTHEVKTPIGKSVLTERGARLMALGASIPYRGATGI